MSVLSTDAGRAGTRPRRSRFQTAIRDFNSKFRETPHGFGFGRGEEGRRGGREGILVRVSGVGDVGRGGLGGGIFCIRSVGALVGDESWNTVLVWGCGLHCWFVHHLYFAWGV